MGWTYESFDCRNCGYGHGKFVCENCQKEAEMKNQELVGQVVFVIREWVFNAYGENVNRVCAVVDTKDKAEFLLTQKCPEDISYTFDEMIIT